MSQLDLPQVSLQRYFDLLKRRRWRVIPVSLLGLVLGGVIAFLIPRFFVADAVLTYQAPLSEVSSVATEDPFVAEVDSARITIPLAIKDCIKQLGWPESTASNPYELGQNLREIEDRLRVDDANPGKGRTFAKIKVTYRDRDGLRAASFVNTLVETWKNQSIANLKARAENAKASATQRYNELHAQYDSYLDQRLQLERTYEIDPQVAIEVQAARYSERLAFEQQRERELAELLTTVADLQRQVTAAESKLGLLEPRIAPELGIGKEAIGKNPAAAALLAEIEYHERAAANLRPGTSDRAAADAHLERLRSKLTKVAGADLADPSGLVPNPAYLAQVEALATLQRDLQRNEDATKVLQQQMVTAKEKMLRLAEGQREYSRLQKALEDTQKSRDAAFARLQAANDMLARLNNQAPVRVESEAKPPPRPTEPNILLVALIGCVLGLGLAIGLILLLDVLQGSFKTIDDVERGLPVPVLGGLSHLETEADRSSAIRSRRRVTLVTALLVMLVSGVVLLFYWDPTRLPPLVRDLLAMVLGAT